jgi:carboxyl-terminal processing protease
MDKKDIDSKVHFNNNLRSIPSFFIVLSFVVGLSIGGFFTFIFSSVINKVGNSSENISTGKSIYSSDIFDIDFVSRIYKLLDEEYMGELPETEHITYSVVKGLISSLEDEYTYFLDPAETEEYLSSRSPDFEGIGVVLSFKEGATYVETVLSNYPAEKAGVQNGDIILSVNGESVEGESPNIVASKIRGEEGTSVDLQVFRPSLSKLLEFKIQREKIEVENISYKHLENGIYQITISQFIDESVNDFNRAWDKVVSDILKEGNLKGVIIDLRSNPGGYVNSVKYVIEEFLKDNQLMMQEETRSAGRYEFRDYRKGKLEDIEMVVLVDEGSASASEIFASAIQDNDRGMIIGMPTLGKGVEQQLIDDLGHNTILVMVFQKWLTPDGRHITKDNPIMPDRKVEFSIETYNTSGIDTQLHAALEELR